MEQAAQGSGHSPGPLQLTQYWILGGPVWIQVLDFMIFVGSLPTVLLFCCSAKIDAGFNVENTLSYVLSRKKELPSNENSRRWVNALSHCSVQCVGVF